MSYVKCLTIIALNFKRNNFFSVAISINIYSLSINIHVHVAYTVTKGDIFPLYYKYYGWWTIFLYTHNYDLLCSFSTEVKSQIKNK